MKNKKVKAEKKFLYSLNFFEMNLTLKIKIMSYYRPEIKKNIKFTLRSFLIFIQFFYIYKTLYELRLLLLLLIYLYCTKNCKQLNKKQKTKRNNKNGEKYTKHYRACLLRLFLANI